MKHSDKKNSNETYLAKWLNNEISDKEVKHFISEEEFLEFVKIRKGMEYFVAPSFDQDQFHQKLTKVLSKKNKKVIRLNWYAIAAAILLLIVSGYFFNASLDIHVKTNTGEQKTIALNDGSEAILNAKSFIRYPKKWKDKRELDLTGEAFFKVKKGKTFTVNTSNGKVTVFGTQFNVNSQANFFLVKCYEGKVRVIYNRDTIFLTKGKAFQKNYNDIKKWDFTNHKPMWLTGESNFKSTPLRIVIKSLENQFNIKIIYKNINTNSLFTGNYGHNNLDIALKSVFLPMNITYKIENKKVFLTKN